MKIKVETTIVLAPVKGESPLLLGTEVDLVLQKPLSPADFFNGDVLNKSGVKLVTNVLVQGLVANVVGAAEHGIRDPKEHVDFIINQIKQSLAAKPTVK